MQFSTFKDNRLCIHLDFDGAEGLGDEGLDLDLLPLLGLSPIVGDRFLDFGFLEDPSLQ